MGNQQMKKYDWSKQNDSELLSESENDAKQISTDKEQISDDQFYSQPLQQIEEPNPKPPQKLPKRQDSTKPNLSEDYAERESRNIRIKRVKAELLQILKKDGEEEKYQTILKQIQLSTSKEQITDILVQFVRKTTAIAMALDFFLGLRKDTIKIPQIELFYETLRSKSMTEQDVSTIKRYVEDGKKQKIKDILQRKLREYEAAQIFSKFESQFPEKVSTPLKCSAFIKSDNGLEIYRYPEMHISEYQKLRAKVIIVLGETGCGKSTFLNSLTNYLAGTQIEDPFRYFIVVENTQSQLKSITSDITSYYLKDVRNGNCYRIIDTPGFGDTEGIDKDQENVRKIEKLFQQDLQEIHLVLFLMKSSTTRITDFQRYIFQSVMDLFDKTIAENFVFVFTFSDASNSAVLEHVMNFEDGFGKYWDLLKEPKTISVNNSGFFQKVSSDDKIKREFWKIGCEFMSKLIAKAEKIEGKALNMTKELILKKSSLSHQIRTTSQKIQNHMVEQENIREQILKILQNEKQMKENEMFEIEVDQQEWYGVSVPNNVTRCNNCMNSNCHDDCRYGDGEQKKECLAMDNQGNCKICPGKCHYVAHTNSHVLRQVRTVEKTITRDELKRNYENAKNKLSWYENSLRSMLKNYQRSLVQTKDIITHMAELQKSLREISLSQLKPLSVKNYIKFLIQNENIHRKIGYQQRIQVLTRTLHQIKIQEQTVKGKTLEETMDRTKQLMQHLVDDPRAKDSEFMKKLREIFAYDEITSLPGNQQNHSKEIRLIEQSSEEEMNADEELHELIDLENQDYNKVTSGTNKKGVDSSKDKSKNSK